jgi:hypothetical protein
LGAGEWGVAAGSYAGDATAAFERITIYEYVGEGTAESTTAQSDDEAQPAFYPVLETTFDDGDAGPYWIGTDELSDFRVIDGWYAMSMQEGYWYHNIAGSTANVTDGAIVVDVALDGRGVAGLIGRYTPSGDAGSFYTCWIDDTAAAGCHALIDGEWYELFAAPAGSFQLQEVNRLSLAIVGDIVSFAVNGATITEFQDASLTGGAWGLYIETYDGPFTMYVDQVTILAYSE